MLRPVSPARGPVRGQAAFAAGWPGLFNTGRGTESGPATAVVAVSEVVIVAVIEAVVEAVVVAVIWPVLWPVIVAASPSTLSR